MPNFSGFRFDISFWIGLAAGLVTAWLFSRLRSIFPHLKAPVTNRIEQVRKSATSGLDAYLRLETLHIAQRMHLASDLFSLDEILVPPHLLAPPPIIEPGQTLLIDTIAGQIIPYLPDYPELTAEYHLHTLSIPQALQNNNNIAIIGQPGSGKTVALAHLATQLARREQRLGMLAEYLPLLLHAVDIDTQLPKSQDPLDNLIKVCREQVATLIRPRLQGYLHYRANAGTLILLLDGLDEISPDALQEMTRFLDLLLKKYPRLRLVVTASSDYINGLTALKLHPMVVDVWNQETAQAFIKKWAGLWAQHIQPNLAQQSTHQVDTRLLLHWLDNRSDFFSPLEWTLKVWAAFAGDIRGVTAIHAIESYIQRQTKGSVPHQSMEALAYEMIYHSQAALNYSRAERFLSRVKLTSKAAEVQALVAQTESGEPPPKKHKGQKTVSSGGRIINIMADSGLVFIHYNDMLRFTHPVIKAYLASFIPEDDQAIGLEEHLNWSVRVQALRYLAARNKNMPRIEPLMTVDERPLYRNLLMAARWLKDLPTNNPFRTNLMRQMFTMIQDDKVPVSIRMRLLAAFIISNDSSRPALFRQLLTVNNPTTQVLAALGLGAIHDEKAVQFLIPAFSNKNMLVRQAVCMATANIDSQTARQVTQEALAETDETVRRAAAEALAGRPGEGHEMLKEAAGSNDIITRRAAVFGLAQVYQKWSILFLEKLAVEDSQWVVRNAAAQMIEALLHAPDPHIPRPLPTPHNASWLIAFAGKQGVGLSPGIPATEILLTALKSENIEERLAALNYLKHTPEEGVISAIYQLLYQSIDPELINASIDTLWFLAISGANLPSPIKYGL